MGSGKVCLSPGFVLSFIYARWKIHFWGLWDQWYLMIFYLFIVYHMGWLQGFLSIILTRIHSWNFFCVLTESEIKTKGFFFFVSITPKTALYPKTRINFILKRNSELCHRGHQRLYICPFFWELPFHHCPEVPIQDLPTAPPSWSHLLVPGVAIYLLVCLFIVVLHWNWGS